MLNERNNTNDAAGPKLTWLDFVADLWSGRLHNTVRLIYKQIVLVSLIYETLTKIREDVNKIMATHEEETRMVQIGERITNVAGSLRSGIEGMKGRTEELTRQAQAPVAAPQPVSLENEFDKIEQALIALEQLGSALSTATGATIPTGAPIGNAATSPIPLAGNTGLTNPPTDPGTGEAVQIEQGQIIANAPSPGSATQTDQMLGSNPVQQEPSASELEQAPSGIGDTGISEGNQPGSTGGEVSSIGEQADMSAPGTGRELGGGIHPTREGEENTGT